MIKLLCLSAWIILCLYWHLCLYLSVFVQVLMLKHRAGSRGLQKTLTDVSLEHHEECSCVCKNDSDWSGPTERDTLAPHWPTQGNMSCFVHNWARVFTLTLQTNETQRWISFYLDLSKPAVPLVLSSQIHKELAHEKKRAWSIWRKIGHGLRVCGGLWTMCVCTFVRGKLWFVAGSENEVFQDN